MATEGPPTQEPSGAETPVECFLGLSFSAGENGVWGRQGFLPGSQLQAPHLPGQKQI